jgi:Peptidase propeptide and YPEB domain
MTPLASSQRPAIGASRMILTTDIPRRGDRIMRRTLNIVVGAGAAAAAAIMVAGVASATSGAPHQAAGPAAAVVSVNGHITKAQAVRIAEAKVPHSRAIEVESDDRHDRAVWKVTLATPHGRVVVDVDKRTGKATVVPGGGHDAAMLATSIGTGSAASAGAWTGGDARDHDGDRRGHDHGDRHDRDRGEDGR